MSNNQEMNPSHRNRIHIIKQFELVYKTPKPVTVSEFKFNTSDPTEALKKLFKEAKMA